MSVLAKAVLALVLAAAAPIAAADRGRAPKWSGAVQADGPVDPRDRPAGPGHVVVDPGDLTPPPQQPTTGVPYCGTCV